jgi:hypothetical protein
VEERRASPRAVVENRAENRAENRVEDGNIKKEKQKDVEDNAVCLLKLYQNNLISY